MATSAVVPLAELPADVLTVYRQWAEIARPGCPDANNLRPVLLRPMLELRAAGFPENQVLSPAGRAAVRDWALPPEQRLPPDRRFGLERCSELVQRSAAARLARLNAGEPAEALLRAPHRPARAATVAREDARLAELRQRAVTIAPSLAVLQRALAARQAMVMTPTAVACALEAHRATRGSLLSTPFAVEARP